MKRFVCLFWALIACYCYTFAQIEFKPFIDSINWNQSEDEFITVYKSKIKNREHHFSKYDNTYTDFVIDSIKIGDFICEADLHTDSITKKIKRLSFSIGDHKMESLQYAIDLSDKMDGILYDLFGEPDKIKNELDNKYVKNLDRVWIKENYIVDVNHMIFSDTQIYALGIKGINDNSPNFRKAKWGESMELIKNKEKKNNTASIDNLYLFEDYVAGKPCEVAYIFVDDKLSLGKYIFTIDHTNKNDYIKDFRELVDLMKQKYGKPDYNGPEWHNSLYKDDYDQYGFAISLGHLSYSAGWLGDITDITVALYGDNYKIRLIIQYVSEKYKALKEKEDKKRKLEGL